MRLLVDAPATRRRAAFDEVAIELRRVPTERVFVVSSAGKGEGKSTLIANVGAVMALSRYRTLLVLGTSQALRALAGDTPVPELADVLMSGDLTEAPEGRPSLFLLKATDLSNLGMYEQQRIVKMLDAARDTFDCVLIDSPSLGEHPFARMWAPYVDGVLLVVRLEGPRRERVQAAKHEIEQFGGKVRGVIVNRCAVPAPRFLFKWFGVADR